MSWLTSKKRSFEVQNLLDRASARAGMMDLESAEVVAKRQQQELIDKIRAATKSRDRSAILHYVKLLRISKQMLTQNRNGQASLAIQANQLQLNYMNHTTVKTMMTTNKSTKQLEKQMNKVDLNKVMRDNALATERIQEQSDRINDSMEDMAMSGFNEEEDIDNILGQLADELDLEELHEMVDAPRHRHRVKEATAAAVSSSAVELK